MDPRWVRSLRDHCATAGVAFFFKQWGGRTAKSNGRLLDGVEHSAFPTEIGTAKVDRLARDHWRSWVQRLHGATSVRRVRLPQLETDSPYGF